MMATINSGPQELGWNVYAGDSNREVFLVETTDPVDLTGATIEAQARKSAIDPEIALAATVIPLDLTLGQFALEWDGEAIRGLLAGQMTWTGVWDVQIQMAGDTLPRTVLKGPWVATHDVTRAGA